MDDRDPPQEKFRLRAEAQLRRLHIPNAEVAGRAILQRLIELPEYRAAKTVLCFVSFRTEISTHELLVRMVEEGKRVVVPYCLANRLELFRFTSFDDLTPRTLGILEPKAELREQDDRSASVEEIDLFVLPGLAFDRQCGRVGYGKGYFDRLLKDARSDALLAAVASECQLFETVPVMAHDVLVDCVVTEAGIYRRTLPRYEAAETQVSSMRDEG